MSQRCFLLNPGFVGKLYMPIHAWMCFLGGVGDVANVSDGENPVH